MLVRSSPGTKQLNKRALVAQLSRVCCPRQAAALLSSCSLCQAARAPVARWPRARTLGGCIDRARLDAGRPTSNTADHDDGGLASCLEQWIRQLACPICGFQVDRENVVVVLLTVLRSRLGPVGSNIVHCGPSHRNLAPAQAHIVPELRSGKTFDSPRTCNLPPKDSVTCQWHSWQVSGDQLQATCIAAWTKDCSMKRPQVAQFLVVPSERGGLVAERLPGHKCSPAVTPCLNPCHSVQPCLHNAGGSRRATFLSQHSEFEGSYCWSSPLPGPALASPASASFEAPAQGPGTFLHM